MSNVSEKTINGILDTMKSLIEKAQIVQGPHSGAGTLDTQTNPEIFQDLETRVGAGAVDYVPTPPGVTDPASGMGGVQKSDSDDDEDEREAEDDEEDEEKEGEEEEDKKEESKKSLTKKKGEKEVPLRGKDKDEERMEKTCMKSQQQRSYDYDYEEVLPVDNVILELTKSIDLAMKSLATRVDFFMKSIGANQYEMMKSLSGLLALTSEGLAKSFDVVKEESHQAARAPKSAFTPDVEKSQEQQHSASYNKEEVLNMMCKSIEGGNQIVKPEDVLLFETSGRIRDEVKKEIGI